MAASREGDVYVAVYGNNGMELRKVDLAAKASGEIFQSSMVWEASVISPFSSVL